MIVKSTSPEVTIPDVSITDYVLRHADRLGDKPALIDGPTGRTLTYRQLRTACGASAAGLAQRGFSKGDVLAIYSPNLPEYAVVMRRGVAGRHQHHRQPALHADELAKQLGLGRPLPGDRAALPRQGAGGGGQERGIEEIFVFGEAPARGRSPS